MKLIKKSENEFILIDEYGNQIGWKLDLEYIKNLVGEVDVEEKAEELTKHLTFPNERKEGIIIGYNQALEDNKDKKYTEEDLQNAWKIGYRGEPIEELTHCFQPKTEWEVEFDSNGKLKLV